MSPSAPRFSWWPSPEDAGAKMPPVVADWEPNHKEVARHTRKHKWRDQEHNALSLRRDEARAIPLPVTFETARRLFLS